MAAIAKLSNTFQEKDEAKAQQMLMNCMEFVLDSGENYE